MLQLAGRAQVQILGNLADDLRFESGTSGTGFKAWIKRRKLRVDGQGGGAGGAQRHTDRLERRRKLGLPGPLQSRGYLGLGGKAALGADYRHGFHFTSLPTAWLCGFDKESVLRIGSGPARVTENLGERAG